MPIRLLFIISLLLSFVAVPASANDNSRTQAFPAASASFAKYIEQVEAYLIEHRMSGRSETEVRLNLPFEIPASNQVPYRGKFLLIHGLNDSAYVWTDTAQVLSQRGFDVRSILLPGHGSHPAEMLDISFNRWLDSVRSHYSLWNTDNTPIYLGGFSMGAVLANILAIENPEIAGLFMISPAYHSRLNSLLRWSGIYAWFRPWMFGGMIREDNPIKYNSIPINSAYQYFLTTQHLKNLLRDDKKHWLGDRLPMPVMMVVTADDSVVDVEYSHHIFERYFRHPDSRFLIYSQSEAPARPREVVRNSYYPKRRILNLSHLGLINAPDNSLFGENGSVLVCNGNEYPIFIACLRSEQHWYGAQHTPSPDGVAVARTTYNPDFKYVFEVFDRVFR